MLLSMLQLHPLDEEEEDYMEGGGELVDSYYLDVLHVPKCKNLLICTLKNGKSKVNVTMISNS